MRHRPQPALADALHAVAEPESSAASRLWLRQQLRDRQTAESIFRHMHREELLRLHLSPTGWWTSFKALTITVVVLVAAIALITLDSSRLRLVPAAPAATAATATPPAEQSPPPCVPCTTP
jgi:hypothetical protein